MKKKTIIILLIIFILLGFIVFYPQFKNFWLKKTNQSQGEKIFIEIPKDSIQQIKIENESQEAIILKKVNHNWQVNDFKADDFLVNNFLEILRQIKIKKVVSYNPQNFSEFDLADILSLSLEITQNNNHKIKFLVGKAGPGYQTVYLKKEGESKVFLTESQVRNYALKSLLDWRDKVLIKLNKEEIKIIELTQEGKKYLLEKNDSKWQIILSKGKEDLEDQKMEDLFLVLSEFKADGFISQDEDGYSDFKKIKKDYFRVLSEDNKELFYFEFIEREGEYWLTPKDSKEIYRLATYNMEKLLPIK